MPKFNEVTRVERKLEKDMVIVSRTCSKGIIEYVNNDFLKAAGYSSEEVIGKAHNILRHPDMPAEVFRDFWETIKKGLTWQGIVKNRCKNGDHYWVLATVTPLKDGGYMSVRYPISDDEKEKASNLYSLMKAQGDKFTAYRGQVHEKGFKFILIKFINKIKSMSLSKKLMIPITVFAGLIGANLFFESKKMEETVLIEAGLSNAESLIQTSKNARIFYNREIIPIAVEKGLRVSHDFRNDNNTVPLPASLMRALGEMSTGESVGEIKLYSRNPFTFNNQTMDSFERDAIQYLERNPNSAYYRIEIENGKPIFRLARSDIMTDQSCIACHNNHPASTKRDWQIGDVRGAISAKIPMENLQSSINSSFNKALITNSIAGFFLIILLLLILNSQIRRINKTENIIKKIAEGDLDVEIDLKDAIVTDEIGAMSNSIMISRNKISEMVAELRHGTKEFENIAKTINEVSSSSVEIANNQHDSANIIAAAVEELSVSVSQLADFGRNVKEISESAGDASHEGAKKVDHASKISANVTLIVKEAEHQLTELEEVSGKISEIVDVISNIADQTNLLALNAAIEAARAGDAGRGFAVVADEVRSLATRTSNSTSQISELITQILVHIEKTSQKVKESVQKVEEGENAQNIAKEAVIAIKKKTEEVVFAANEIRNTLEEQEKAANDAARSVSEIAETASYSSEKSKLVLEESKNIIPLSKRFRELSTSFKLLGK